MSSGIPIIRGNNLTTGMEKFVDDGFVYLNTEKALEFSNCEAIQNDIVFTAAGTIGQVGIIPRNSKFSKYIISNKQLRARLNTSEILPIYAFYWLSSPRMRDYIIQRK